VTYDAGVEFVDRERELTALDEWWGQPGAAMALLWGRRRVGKTTLLQRFARDKPAVNGHQDLQVDGQQNSQPMDIRNPSGRP
jgi:predicted AAA+ superfamily ATPase